MYEMYTLQSTRSPVVGPIPTERLEANFKHNEVESVRTVAFKRLQPEDMVFKHTAHAQDGKSKVCMFHVSDARHCKCHFVCKVSD